MFHFPANARSGRLPGGASVRVRDLAAGAAVLLVLIASRQGWASGPTISFSTYFGSSGAEAITGVAVDAAGNIYVTGWTESASLPIVNAAQSTFGGSVDAFVAKFDPTGSTLLYSTFLGGSGDDRGFAIAVDASGNAYITGWTYSTNFPVTASAPQPHLSSGRDAFVAKLSPSGNQLLYSTYLGGYGSDAGRTIAVDGSGNVYLAGETTSWNFPSLLSVQSSLKGAQNAFITSLNASGQLRFSTLLGGSGTDGATAVAVDGSGNVYVTGGTTSLDFPVTANAFQRANKGYQNVFVSSLAAAGNAMLYSTYLGGSGATVIYPEMGFGIDVDAAGSAYVTGVAASSDFPIQNALQPELSGSLDAFVTKLNPAGGALVFSTFLGGSSIDEGNAIRVSNGAPCIAGYTASLDYPVVNPVQAANAGSYDAVLSCLNASGNTITFSTLLGGTDSDSANALALSGGFGYVAGLTFSRNFPVAGAYQPLNGGQEDGFLAKLLQVPPPLPAIPALTLPANGAIGVALNPTLGWSASSTATSYAVYLGTTNPPPLLGTTTANTYVPGTLGPATPYYWQVAATNTVGSVNSAISSFTTLACTYVLGASSAAPDASGGAASVSVTSFTGCGWTASSNATWLTVTGGNSGSGNGTVNYTVSPNSTANARSGTLSIGGQTFTVNQGGQGCSYAPTLPTCASLGVAKSHSGNFTQGQNGATYSVTVANAPGAGPTGGTVTVTETLPSGLTLVSMAGTGWTCPGTAANNCTRSDSLNSGASYPAITVTVNVAANAGTPLANSVSVSGGASATATATDPATIAPPALRFVPITPCRIADTRTATGPFGGPIISGGSSRDFTIPSSACGIPSTAQAYSLNVAVVPATTLGYLTLYPAGQSRPLASTLNSLDGRIKSNAAIVPAGAGGAISVFASDTTQVILDINGYFVPATDPTGLAFYPIPPCRIADTRTAAAPLGGPALVGGQSRTLPILASACNLPATAQAYSLNFAAVPNGSLGYLTAWPTGQSRPLAASLNALTGAITANAAIVPAGANGSVDVFDSDATNLVIDINGYFAPMGTGGLSLYGVTPCRVVDTRLPAGSPPITSLNVAVSASACGIPANAQADVMSVTVVPPASLGYLTLWPQGQTRPVVSTLNALDGAITSNLAIVPTSNGSISVFPSNPTHLVVDIYGYFAQ